VTSRLVALVAALALHATSLVAQPAGQTPTQFTVYYDYTVLPGKEAEFIDLVKAVGGPVRDTLLADGVISEWGIERPLLRAPGGPTLSVWYVAGTLEAVGKVQAAIADVLQKPVAGASGARAGKATTNGDRGRELLDVGRTRDWLFRDLENGYGTTMPQPGAQPFIRYVTYKVHAGKSREFRETFDTYNKPILDTLVKDGVVEAWGLAIEDVKTTGDFTHLLWIVTPDLAGMDKVRAAVNADRDKRSPGERDALTAAFMAVSDLDASRSQIAQIIHLRMAGQK
jgi:hypothetical protein